MLHDIPRQRSRLPTLLAVLAVLLALAYLGWQYWAGSQAETPVSATVTMAPADPQPVAPAPDPPSAPAIAHPVDAMPDLGTPTTTAQPAAPLPALAEADGFVTEQLGQLLSRPQVLRFLQLDGFVQRVVATVDNLARSHAPAARWPVNPTPERFTTQRNDAGVETLHPDNSQRYTPLVQLIESVDTAQAVRLYRSLYPLFQQAYQELGFPDSYFNDRLVLVLDQLIATPVPATPPAVQLVEVKGPVPSLRPWVRYEYADPALEASSAGQKILLRVGPDHQRRLQTKLRDIRQRVAR